MKNENMLSKAKLMVIFFKFFNIKLKPIDFFQLMKSLILTKDKILVLNN